MCHALALICCQVSCYFTPPPPPLTHILYQTNLPHHRSRAMKISKYFVCLSADSKACVSKAGRGAAPRGRRKNLARTQGGSLLAVMPSQGRLRVVSGWRTMPASGAQGRVKHQEKWREAGGRNWGSSNCSTHLYLMCILEHIVLIMRCRLGCLSVSCN